MLPQVLYANAVRSDSSFRHELVEVLALELGESPLVGDKDLRQKTKNRTVTIQKGPKNKLKNSLFRKETEPPPSSTIFPVSNFSSPETEIPLLISNKFEEGKIGFRCSKVEKIGNGKKS